MSHMIAVNFATGSVEEIPVPDDLRLAAEAANQKAERQRRLDTIDARLATIDSLAIRPLRAAVAGTASQADTDKLAALEIEAASLRLERAALLPL